ncbi:MAG: NAD(P)/FAD-dependent oxidoreductase [bacterium]|nr:MAG: NAD(P)/FAD-dependent oxidoreductase [bacterium]
MPGNKTINIVGAGPGGFTAAISLAKNGYSVNLYEKNVNAGSRFNGDFQGLENWSDDEDTLNILDGLGIKINFLCHPYSGNDGYFIGPNRKKIQLKTSRPLFYLIERGYGENSLDQGLRRQAEESGVNILWKHKLDSLEDGYAIVGTGPKVADAIAKGIVFKTSYKNIYVGFVDNRIAPQSYAYLLVNNGRATFATCIFKDFKNEKIYFKRALQVLNSSIDIDIVDAKEFSGFVNFFTKPILSKDNRIFYVGENAGFQDALWGFGIKYAMLSGYYAAKSIIDNQDYTELCKTHLYPKFRTSLANRWLYSHLYNPGYNYSFKYMAKLDDVIPLLRKHYNISFSKKLIYKIAKGWYHTRLKDKQCLHVHCSCVWCRHGKHEHASVENC